jgi:hypothetical protein
MLISILILSLARRNRSWLSALADFDDLCAYCAGPAGKWRGPIHSDALVNLGVREHEIESELRRTGFVAAAHNAA